MRRAIPLILGIALLLLGVGWASQGDGLLGGGGFIDNNTTFIYLGGFLALVGIVLITFGTVVKEKIPVS